MSIMKGVIYLAYLGGLRLALVVLCIDSVFGYYRPIVIVESF